MRYPTPALQRIRVLDVHDGDTTPRSLVDRGGPAEQTEIWSIRFKDVFAPELSQPGGPECRQFVIDWFAAHDDGSDWPFMLETFRTPKSDKIVTTLSRIVGVYTAPNGDVLNHDVEAFIKAHPEWGGGIGGGTAVAEPFSCPVLSPGGKLKCTNPDVHPESGQHIWELDPHHTEADSPDV